MSKMKELHQELADFDLSRSHQIHSKPVNPEEDEFAVCLCGEPATEMRYQITQDGEIIDDTRAYFCAKCAKQSDEMDITDI